MRSRLSRIEINFWSKACWEVMRLLSFQPDGKKTRTQGTQENKELKELKERFAGIWVEFLQFPRFLRFPQFPAFRSSVCLLLKPPGHIIFRLLLGRPGKNFFRLIKLHQFP